MHMWCIKACLIEKKRAKHKHRNIEKEMFEKKTVLSFEFMVCICAFYLSIDALH